MSTVNTMAVFVCLALLCGCESKSSPPGETDDVTTNSPPVDSSDEGKPDGFAVSNHYPQVDDEDVALVTPIIVTFNEPIMDTSYSDDLVQVTINDSPVDGEQHRIDENTLQFVPYTLLQANATYRVTVSDQVMSQSGDTPTALEWQFETVADVYTTPQDVIDQCMSEMDIAMLAAVNTARGTGRNCGADFMSATHKLVWNCDLQAAAIHHAVDMSDNNHFSHTGSDGSSVGMRATRAGYQWSIVDENITAGQRNVAEVMSGLLNTPGHCQNIMSPHYAEFGFGYSVDSESDHGRYWAQIFAYPR